MPGTAIDSPPLQRPTSHLTLGYRSLTQAWGSMQYLPQGLTNPALSWLVILLIGLDEFADTVEIFDSPVFWLPILLGLQLGLSSRGAAAQAITSQLPPRTVRTYDPPKLLERIGIKSAAAGPRPSKIEPAPSPSRRRIWILSGGLWPSAAALIGARLVFAGASLVLLVALPAAWTANLRSDFWATLWALALAPVILLGLGYALVVDCSFHLAMQSLAANRRGAGSAMQHAWRLATGDVGSMAKSALLHATALALPVLLFGATIEGLFNDEFLPALMVALALSAFLSNAMFHYWARCYRRMGGIHTVQPARVRGAGPNPGALAGQI